MVTDRKTALVTGASAGLGVEYARLFAQNGHDVILVARRRAKLDELASELARAHGVRVTVIAADLTDPATPASIFGEVVANRRDVEFLVNNAGFGSNGRFVDLDTKQQLDMIEVNVRALVHLTRLFLPPMVARKSGRVLNIGSTAGFVPGPFMATYHATKAFVISFSEALSVELSGTGVTATVSCPGATATEFAGNAGNDRSRLFQSRGVASAADAAAHGYRAMMAGKAVAVAGAMNALTVQSVRLGPRSMVRRIAARLNRPKA